MYARMWVKLSRLEAVCVPPFYKYDKHKKKRVPPTSKIISKIIDHRLFFELFAKVHRPNGCSRIPKVSTSHTYRNLYAPLWGQQC